MSRRATILSILVTAAAAAGSTEPPLPPWSEALSDGDEAGRWARVLLVEDWETLLDPPAGEEPAETTGVAPVEPLTADEPEPRISDAHLDAYFAARPEDFLVDPQQLLPSPVARDRLAFLNNHADESAIDLFIYLFDEAQEIPGEIREEETIERFYSDGKPAAVVFYYLGEPQRSALYLSPTITDAVSAAEQRRALQSSVMQAFTSTEPLDQLQAFLVQMAIRLYWMERMHEEAAMAAAPAAAPAVDEASAPAASNPTRFRMPEIPPPARGWLVALGVAAAAGAGFRIWHGARARYSFPDFDVEPRLGGRHAAGVGAVISFLTPNVPPSSQRDQVPDYLRRM